MGVRARDRALITAAGGEIVEEDYYPLDHTDYGDAIEKIMSGGAEVVFNTIVPPAVVPFFQQLHDAGFSERGGHLVCTYFDENCLNLVPAEQVEGLYSCLDYYRDAEDPFSRELLDRYNTRYPGGAMFTGGGACSGMYRGMRLWEAAIREAGSLDQGEVIEALDHAKIAVGPGGPGADDARAGLAAARDNGPRRRPGRRRAALAVHHALASWETLLGVPRLADAATVPGGFGEDIFTASPRRSSGHRLRRARNRTGGAACVAMARARAFQSPLFARAVRVRGVRR